MRNSRMLIGETYFWTCTIKDWKKILAKEEFKALIIDCLKELVEKQLIKVYAFVVMPNHLHLIWEMLGMNKKEMPHATFNKKTSHLIIRNLKLNYPHLLHYFTVAETDRSFRIWQRDALAILMDNVTKLEQKIDYTHLNPLQERWNLANSPETYYWSSASFYEKGVDEFGFLTHYRDRF